MHLRPCLQCGRSISASASFCKHCGTPTTVMRSSPGLGSALASFFAALAARISSTTVALTCCPHCHARMAATAKFCGQCGRTPSEEMQGLDPPEQHRPIPPRPAPVYRQPVVSHSAPDAVSSSAKALGVASVILGALTFGVQWFGGLCCGQVGWPLGIAVVLCGILAIVGGEKTLGWIGISLSVAMLLLQVFMLTVGIGSLGAALRNGFK